MDSVHPALAEIRKEFVMTKGDERIDCPTETQPLNIEEVHGKECQMSSSHWGQMTISAVSLFLFLAGQAFAADSYGTWIRPSTGAHVNFYQCGGKLCAKIVSVKTASQSQLVGTLIINGAAPVGASQWKGDLLDPETNKTYAGTITIAADKLTLKGCVMGLVCESEYWTPAN